MEFLKNISFDIYSIRNKNNIYLECTEHCRPMVCSIIGSGTVYTQEVIEIYIV